MSQTIYALGFFDGVHVGHRALLNMCRELAREHGCETGAVTFGSHPDAQVLGRSPALICTAEDRNTLLRGFVSRIVVLPFDRKMRTTQWQAFLDMLRRDYDAAGFVCGDDFRFGDKGAGNARKLEEYCREAGLPCAVVPEQTVNGIRVSSTYIRELLEQGEVEQANWFLGHPYILSGQVIHGRQLGRRLGIPTANLVLPKDLAVPNFGVYACTTVIDGREYCAVTNVGIRPTVSGIGITVEPWIQDYEGDLYGRELTLEFHLFLRPERRFEGLEELRAEVLRNAEQTKSWFASRKEEKA